MPFKRSGWHYCTKLKHTHSPVLPSKKEPLRVGIEPDMLEEGLAAPPTGVLRPFREGFGLRVAIPAALVPAVVLPVAKECPRCIWGPVGGGGLSAPTKDCPRAGITGLFNGLH